MQVDPIPRKVEASSHTEVRMFAGKRVTIAGVGHFGGSVAAAKWLAGQGARLLITDKAPPGKLADALGTLQGVPAEYRLGEHREEDFTRADLVVASPAISPGNPYLQAARAAGVPITTEICLFAERCRAPIIGVTGTKGKSTTSAMLGQILSRRFTTWFGGNIGKSLLEDLPAIEPDHVVVLELSSFMLHYLGERRWSPHVAVVTLLAPDHLDWHGSFDAYADAKRNIIRFQKPGDIAVVNEESEALAEWQAGSPAKWIRYGVAGRRAFELRVPGRHNQLNAQGAYAAAMALGVTWEETQAALRDFAGLPHRLQLVHEADGVRWFNDSIATIPEAAAAALAAFEPGRVIQIVGGSDKGLDPGPMVEAIARRAKAVLCIGTTGPQVAAAIRAAGGAQVEECADLDAAVRSAKTHVHAGDVVLLSTGFASYDQFANFEDRGDRFARLAQSET
jgi:UDP-N-acetylmuramoylalanine--D-glutamate ligase